MDLDGNADAYKTGTSAEECNWMAYYKNKKREQIDRVQTVIVLLKSIGMDVEIIHCCGQCVVQTQYSTSPRAILILQRPEKTF